MGAIATRCRGGTSAGMEALQIRAATLLGEVVQGPQPQAAVCGMSLPQKAQRCYETSFALEPLCEREGTEDTSRLGGRVSGSLGAAGCRGPPELSGA